MRRVQKCINLAFTQQTHRQTTIVVNLPYFFIAFCCQGPTNLTLQSKCWYTYTCTRRAKTGIAPCNGLR